MLPPPLRTRSYHHLTTS